METVILGAKGMLGQALAAAFAAWEPVLWDRRDLDITDGNAVQVRLQELAPELIINAAAYTDVDGAEDNRTMAYLVNEAGVRNIARTANEIGAIVVHYSTDYVFSGEQEFGYREDEPSGPPVNAYGASKLAGERVLAEELPEHYLIRTAWLYGAGGKNFVDTMLQLGREKRELRVVNDQHGNPTYAADLARATFRLLDEEYDPDVYHLVNRGVTTWYDLASEIFRQASMQVKVVPVTSAEFSRPAKRPPYSVLRNTHGPIMRQWDKALYDYIATVV
ncbi:MAG: dTDP-4-dehydrorhamnose reductase [Candidatus Andersenbacteria bacterium CG10_big_fil_rev_8_21_14_0_10_54_11]|uniref:dTDP-4-dehydrorhamnose reductase n=1 Tax=Candidatus Andersenbacteria bacterium CG10_big_fil_rev_8_21_14_0_10_54_11 TaxID=1974485 RepID=A0A2M6WZG0_9BACT|nr:MAG: dTDP-4-dehydrorhamnose reductase [Candidatus Andersenbacteria bacterium CG10_big_fil_rev_8_21_14_0_10_54_11]